MTTEKGVWNIQQVRDKQLQSAWKTYSGPQELWLAGKNTTGQLGQNETAVANRSSPVQIPGTTWAEVIFDRQYTRPLGMKTDGSIWAWGDNEDGNLGQNNETQYSSPVQVMGGSGSIGSVDASTTHSMAVKSDGTLWAWGEGSKGQLANNSGGPSFYRSSPIQITGDWSRNISAGVNRAGGVKTDGTLWMWGYNNDGVLGQNETYAPSKRGYSSPVQIPGTWSTSRGGFSFYAQALAIKGDGTLWAWGKNEAGNLGLSNKTTYSSPVQVGSDTTWAWVNAKHKGSYAVKTDGTLWSWGYNSLGGLGHNNQTEYSSPKQVGSGTDWSKTWGNETVGAGLKTDGTAWMWGRNSQAGQQGHNNTTDYSSPKQVPGNYIWISPANYNAGFIKEL